MTNTHMYPALSVLERQHPPTRYGRLPLFRHPPLPVRDVLVPSWNWHSPHQADAETITLDTNAQYLAAAGSVEIAHGDLKRLAPPTGPLAPRDVMPGMYLIERPYWAFSGTIVSPMGDSSRLETEERLWVAHPTLVLLLELAEQNALSHVTIVDAYATAARTRLAEWTAALKPVRLGRLDDVEAAHPDGRPSGCECGACLAYKAFKEGYSSALSMMLTGEKCKTHRPDWSYAVYAQAAATMWRKAWRYTSYGRPVLRMGNTDTMTVLAGDLHEILAKPKPPFRFDPTGRVLGALKPTAEPDVPAQRVEAVPTVDDTEDIL